jgi:hypothetical protein
MRIFRRRIRNLFVLQAVLLFAAVVATLVLPRYSAYTVSPLRHYGILVGCLGFGLVFGRAWWSTRGPIPGRNPWAIAASAQWVAVGVPFLWFFHSSFALAGPGLLITVVGLVGVLSFSRSGNPAQLQPSCELYLSPPARTSVAGDRTSTWTNHGFAALAVIAEFAAIFLWAHWARTHGLGRGPLPWYLVVPIAVLGATLLHESGHALLAWALKRELLSFNAGPFQWRKREGSWKFKFDAEGFYNVGTAIRLTPSDPDQPRARDLWVIAAGPLANLVWGSLALWAVTQANWPFYQQTWRLVAFTASFCLIAAVTNLLPFMTEDGGYSDGARILQMVTNSPLDDRRRTTDRRPSALAPPLLQAPEM